MRLRPLDDDGTSGLAADLPESTSFQGRAYQYFPIDPASGDLLAGPTAPAATANPTGPDRLALRVSERVSVSFGALHDLWTIGRPALLAFWLRCDDPVPVQGLVYGGREVFDVRVEGGRLRVKLGMEQLPRIDLDTEIAHDQWRHVAIRFTGVKGIHRDDTGHDGDTPIPEAEKKYPVTGTVVAAAVYVDGQQAGVADLFFPAVYDHLPLQFLTHRTVSALDAASNSELEVTGEFDRDRSGLRGSLSQVQLFRDARGLDVERLAFGDTGEAVPDLLWGPVPSTQGQLVGLVNRGSSPAQPQVAWPDGVQHVQAWSGKTDDVPPPPSRAVRLALARVALQEMARTGVPDPVLVVNPEVLRSPRDTAAVRRLLASFGLDELMALFADGHRFCLQPKTGGGFDLVFAPGEVDAAGIVLVEQYALTSATGRAGRGRLLQTLCLAPGETAEIVVNSYRRSEETRERTESILDSYSDEASRNFEQTLSDQRTDEQTRATELAYHADVSGQASWGWGSVQASAGVSGSTAENRRQFTDNVASAVQQHAQTTSVARNLEVSTSTTTTVEQGSETDVHRTVSNINLSRSMTTSFYQVNQEVASLLHLVDLRVGFFDSTRGVRDEASLAQGRQLLAKYLSPARLDADWAHLTQAVQQLLADRRAQLTPEPQDGLPWYRDGDWRLRFVDTRLPRTPPQDTPPTEDGSAPEPLLVLPGAGEDGEIQFNQRFRTEVEYAPDGGVQLQLSVPGLLTQAQRHVVRTESMVGESFLNHDWALDAYSTRLQEAEASRVEAEAERRRAEAALLAARATVADEIARSPLDPLRKADILRRLDPRAVPGETTFRTSFGGSFEDAAPVADPVAVPAADPVSDPAPGPVVVLDDEGRGAPGPVTVVLPVDVPEPGRGRARGRAKKSSKDEPSGRP